MKKTLPIISTLIIVLILSLSVLTFAQNTDTGTIDALLNNPDCDTTCFMGIEVGITTEAELIDLLDANDISVSTSTEEEKPEETIYSWRLQDQVSGVPAGSIIRARTKDALVVSIYIPLTYSNGDDVINIYGTPDTTTLSSLETFDLNYIDLGLTLLQSQQSGAITGIRLFAPGSVIRPPENEPIIANAGPDMVIDDLNGYPALATLDGTQSIVNNGTITSISWNRIGETLSTESIAYVPLEYGNYVFVLTIENDRGDISFDTVRVSVVESEEQIENGLVGEYYRSLNLKDLQFTRIDPMINFDWGLGAPRADMSNLNFSIVWRGQLRAPITGTYTFSSGSDDGISMWINGDKVYEQLIYENSAPAEVELKGGENYDIRLEYFEAGGNAKVDLLWTIPQLSDGPELIAPEYFSHEVIVDDVPPLASAGPDQIIPIEDATSTKVSLDASASVGRDGKITSYQWLLNNELISEEETTIIELKAGIYDIELIVTDQNGLIDRDHLIVEVNNFSPLSGLHAEYFSTRSLTNTVLERIDRVVNFQWGYIAPDPTMNTSNYSVRWTGFIQASETGIHRIYTYNDDGARMRMSNKLLIDDWNNHRPLYNSFNFYMKAGILYPIELEYYQGAGNGVIQLLWLTPSAEEFTVIPQSNLFQPEYVAPEPGEPES